MSVNLIFTHLSPTHETRFRRGTIEQKLQFYKNVQRWRRDAKERYAEHVLMLQRRVSNK